jgi:cytochrome c oxidase subunit 4
VCVTLLALTAATTAVAYVDLGRMNTPVALAIAVFKALLVIAFFMHVGRRSLLIIVHTLSGVLLLAALILLAVVDVAIRS